jgi:anti-anti-sigma factor
MADLGIKIRELDGHTVAEIEGDVDLYNVGKLKKSLFDIIDKGAKSLVVDMKNVSYMDSSGIGALVASQKRIKANNGKFALINVSEDVLNVLKLSTLDKFFKIYANEEELLANQ